MTRTVLFAVLLGACGLVLRYAYYAGGPGLALFVGYFCGAAVTAVLVWYWGLPIRLVQDPTLSSWHKHATVLGACMLGVVLWPWLVLRTLYGWLRLKSAQHW